MIEQSAAAQRPLFSQVALRRLIIPLILEQLLAMTVGLAATVMITRVGESAVSGVSLVDSLNNLIISVLTALCTGGAVVCAQYLGRRDPAQARNAARQLLYIAFAFSAVLCATLLIAPSFFIRIIYGALDSAVQDSAATYLFFSALSFPFLAIYSSCAALFRAMGNSRVSLLASLLMNVVNIAANALLIYQFRLGVTGAGVATLLARIVACVVMLRLIRSQHNPIYLKNLLQIQFDGGVMRSILSIGVPTGFENGLFHFGKLLVQTLVASLGTSAIAANAILGSIANLTIVPGLGISLAMITVFGQCVGAGDYKQAVMYLKKLLFDSFLAMAIVNLPLLFFSKSIVGLFPISQEAFSISVQVLPLLAIANTVFWPLSFVFPNALRAAGDARFTMIVSSSTMWVVRFGLSYVFVRFFGLGLAGVWYCMIIDWIVRCLFFALRYRGGKWRTKRVIR